MPTELVERTAGPFADRLFRSYESLIAMKNYIGRYAGIIYLGKFASKPQAFHLGLSKADKEEYIMVKRILRNTTIRSLIEANTKQAVVIYCRMVELMYNNSVASQNQDVLYNALIIPAGLNFLHTVGNIFLELPHAVQVEVKCPF